MNRALISVSDKSGLTELANALAQAGIELVSTGGTAKALREAGLPVTDVADVTGFPEIMDGRVKTLHPKIHGGLLARADKDDAVLAEQGIEAIDIVVVNLYPFRKTIERHDTTLQDAIENIDIGGPAMIRAAAKNHARVVIVVEPSDYPRVIAAIEGGGFDDSLKRELAARAYAHTAAYDTAIAGYLGLKAGLPALGDSLTIGGTRIQALRYGENPHQAAAFYRDSGNLAGTLAGATQIQGKALSFNNIADADAALECVRTFDEPACVIVKHANPCGVAVATDIGAAYDAAYATDPTSAFGGIIAVNRTLDAATAGAIVERQFVEVIIAPDVDDGARRALQKKKNARVLVTGDLERRLDMPIDVRKVSGGLLAQSRDDGRVDDSDLKVVTARQPTAAQMADLRFAWKVVKFVKSNAIVFCRDGRTLGVGAGQMSRVYSTRIAAIKAADERLDLAGSVMASDAFFPFRDGIDSAVEHGISCVIQPGGSMRDDEVIAAADEHGLAMVLTGMRHFRH